MTKTKFTILILILLTLGLVVSGCLKKPVVNQNANANTNTSEIDTSDWKTYRNEEYGFEVKYPGGWFIDTCKKEQGFEDIIAILSDNEIFCYVNMNESKVSLEIIEEYNFYEKEDKLLNFKREDFDDYVRVSGDLPYRDGDGNIRPGKWIKFIDVVIRNEKDNFLLIRFHDIYDIKNQKILEENILKYNIFVDTFKFVK